MGARVLWGVACGIVVVACASRSSGDESSTPTRDSKEASFPEEGWAMQGYGHSLYQLRIDAPSAGRSQAPWLLEPRPTTPGDAPATHYATWMRHIQAAPYRQKRVRFSVSARTSGATTRGDVWARAQSATSPADGEGLVGQFNRMPADSEWNEYAVVFDVPEDAAWLEYGVGTSPFGKVWFEPPRLEVVDTSVPVTAVPKPRR